MSQGTPKEIYVTKPRLPSLEDLQEKLKQIWKTGLVTNNGPLHKEFEQKLSTYLGVEFLSLFSSGTTALLTAQKAIELKGGDNIPILIYSDKQLTCMEQFKTSICRY